MKYPNPKKETPEAEVRNYLHRRCIDFDIKVKIKLEGTNLSDWLLIYKGVCFLLELKATGKKARLGQILKAYEMAEEGCYVIWDVDSRPMITKILKCIKLKSTSHLGTEWFNLGGFFNPNIAMGHFHRITFDIWERGDRELRQELHLPAKHYNNIPIKRR